MKRVGVAVLLAAALAVVFGACSRTAQFDCPLEELILDETAFPSGTELGGIVSPLPDEPGSSAGRTFYMEQGIANHDVVRYANNYWAKREFDDRKRSPIFNTPNNRTEMPGIDYSSPVANQYRLGCGREHDIYLCQMIGQYENYFVYFSIHIDPDVIEVAEVDGILREIDARMAHCLKRASIYRTAL